MILMVSQAIKYIEGSNIESLRPNDLLIQPQLKQHIIRFNHYIIEQAHCSWLSYDTGIEKLDLASAPDETLYYLSEWLFKKYQVDEQCEYDFSDKVKRLFLLPTIELNRLIIITGLTAHQDEIGKIISGKELRYIKQIFGDTLMAFTRNKAPFMMSTPFYYALDASVPETYFKKPSAHAPEDISDSVYKSGLRILGAALGSYPKPLKRRLMWKLDRKYKSLIKVSFGLANDQDRFEKAGKLLLKLTRELDKSCSQLFK